MTTAAAGTAPAVCSPEREYCLPVAPNIQYFCENLLVTGYDPIADVALWTHLGTYPDDFALWEEQLYICLPGNDGLLWTVGAGRPAISQRPSGPNLRYRCIEPFRRWEVCFDAAGVRTPYAETLAGRARDGRHERFKLNLDLEMTGPVWDAQTSAKSHVGVGDMSEQVWASDHYEQLYRFAGELVLEERTIKLSGTGLRDHSRGARGGSKMKLFGGHVLIGVQYESGNAFGLQRMYSPEGKITLDTGYVVLNGQFQHAEVLEVPALGEDLQISGEKLRARLRSSAGEHVIEGELMKASLVSAYLPGTATGADFALPNPFIFSQGHARWTWDSETGYGLTERSRTFKRRMPV